MDPKTIGSFLEQEWAVITVAPLTFAGAVIALGLLIWAAIHFAYKSRLESARGEIKNKDSEISLLNRQLKQANADIKAFQKPIEPKKAAEIVRQWPEPLRRTFKKVAEGEHLVVKARPQTPDEVETTAAANYLVWTGLADIEVRGEDYLTVGSSSSTGPVFTVFYVEGGKKNSD